MVSLLNPKVYENIWSVNCDSETCVDSVKVARSPIGTERFARNMAVAAVGIELTGSIRVDLLEFESRKPVR